MKNLALLSATVVVTTSGLLFNSVQSALTSPAQATVSYKVNGSVLSTISSPLSPVISTPGMLKNAPINTKVAQALEQDRYAAIWEQSSGPAWQARHGLTSAQYQTTFNQLVGQGYRLVNVSGYSVNGQDRYAAIWEQSYC